MKKLLFICKELIKGKSVTRSFLNYRLSHEVLKGDVIDIGGGTSADYISFMNREKKTDLQTFDLRHGDSIDFETDRLPALDHSYDTVLFLNVLEHVFNYQHIAAEVVRITKKDGRVIGFVPFLMWYHPDHKDFFRYTHEALRIIFTKGGADQINIEAIEMGPFVAATHMYLMIFPKILRPFIFTLSFLFDAMINRIVHRKHPKYVLGYFFTLKPN